MTDSQSTDDPLGEEPTDPESRQRRRWRSWLSLVVGILACISLLASVIGVWTYRTLFDTDKWIERVAELPTNPQVADALATRVTDELFAAADVQQRLAAALPDRVSIIAGPVTGAAKSIMYDAIYRTLQSEKFQQLWIAANRAVHERVVAILKGEQTGRLISQDGSVAINLLPLVSRALSLLHDVAPDLVGTGTPPTIDPSTPVDEARTQLSTYLGRQLKPGFGEIVVFQSDQLAAVQEAVQLTARLLVVLLVLTVALFIASILLAGRRLLAVAWLGAGTAATVVVIWAIGRAVGNQLIDSIQDDKAKGAARTTVTSVFESLRSFSTWVIAASILIAVAAFVTSDSHAAKAIRNQTGRVFSSLAKPAEQSSPLVNWIRHHAVGLRLAGLVAGLVALALLNLTWGVLVATLVVVVLYELAVFGVARAATTPTTPTPATP
jgi:hypothetical protein